MAQFDVHALPGGEWVVDVQADVVAAYGTRVVIPLLAPEENDRRLPQQLNPKLRVLDEERLLATHLISVVRQRDMSPPIASVLHDDLIVKSALDFLISGF